MVWNLACPRPKAVEYSYSIAAVWGEDTPLAPEGALALPGDYDVALIVDGQESHQTLTVVPDPRAHATRAELEQAFAFYRDVEAELAKAWQTYGEIDAVHEQIETTQKNATATKLGDIVDEFDKQLVPLRAGKSASSPNVGAIAGELALLATDVESTDAAPTEPQQRTLAYMRDDLARASGLWSHLCRVELAVLNGRLRQGALPAISAPVVAQIHIDDLPEGKDLP